MELLDSIRDDLISHSANIANTLRKARVLAHEYRSPELREWVEFELNGYSETAQLPTYRRREVPLMGTFHGPFQRRMTGVSISAAGLPESVKEIAESLYVFEGVAALEEVLASNGNRLSKPLPLEITALLRESVQMTGGMVLFEAYQPVPRYVITGILDSVQNRLLEFVLELKELENNSGGVNSGDVEPEAIRNAVNINIYGNNNVVAGGENIRQSIAPILQGDLNSLAANLRAHRVDDDDIRALKDAISLEPDATAGEFGPRVSAWVGNMIAKAVSGTWQAGLARAPTLLVEAIKSYYGG